MCDPNDSLLADDTLNKDRKTSITSIFTRKQIEVPESDVVR